MKLVSFTVEKYRSITKAHKIRLGKTAIFVGPNNEGKSNILRALVAAMNILTRARPPIPLRRSQHTRLLSRQFYEWATDFPVHLQNKYPNGESVMILEFELTQEELNDFRTETGSNLSGTLPLRIALGPEETKVRVYKSGKGSKALTAKSNRIASFVSTHLDFEHIPAVRTAQSAQRIVDEMVERELIRVEGDPEYEKALGKIEELQKPILNLLSSSIQDTLVKFLPAISDVRVQVAAEERYRALRRSCEIVIDDGTPTLLKYKGDGVQSLAALGIMRHASERGARGKNLVIAIEEPESH
jgi:putative ATP-dependent endonuclease of OLD family